MNWLETLLFIPVALIAFIASIVVPISTIKGMNKFAEILIKNDNAKLEKAKKINESAVVAAYLVLGVIISIFIFE